jgi:predicted amidohydrolase
VEKLVRVMKIYCVQYDIAWEDKPANHAKIRRMLADAQPQRDSLVLLPEMFSTGFSMNTTRTSDTETREDQQFLSQIASDLGVYIVGGITTIDASAKALNEAAIFDPTGEEIARYAKLQPYTNGKEAQHFRGGESIVHFKWHDMSVCPFICYDLRFPEHFRRGVRGGAELFLVIANWPARRVDHWIALLRARAIENQAYVAAVNRCGRDPHLEYPGSSLIIDPQGKVLADAGADERVISADVDVAAVRSWRSEFSAVADMREELK